MELLNKNNKIKEVQLKHQSLINEILIGSILLSFFVWSNHFQKFYPQAKL